MTQLTKKQLIEYLADQSDLTQTIAKRLLEALTAAVHDGLANGHDFTLPGIGKLSVRNRAPRTGRNPQTGEPVLIEARLVVAFKPAKTLAESVNRK